MLAAPSSRANSAILLMGDATSPSRPPPRGAARARRRGSGTSGAAPRGPRAAAGAGSTVGTSSLRCLRVSDGDGPSAPLPFDPHADPVGQLDLVVVLEHEAAAEPVGHLRDDAAAVVHEQQDGARDPMGL